MRILALGRLGPSRFHCYRVGTDAAARYAATWDAAAWDAARHDAAGRDAAGRLTILYDAACRHGARLTLASCGATRQVTA
jgi:hypothetical protein